MKSEKDSSFLKTKDQSSIGWFLVFYLFIVLVFIGIGPKIFSSTWISLNSVFRGEGKLQASHH